MEIVFLMFATSSSCQLPYLIHPNFAHGKTLTQHSFTHTHSFIYTHLADSLREFLIDLNTFKK